MIRSSTYHKSIAFVFGVGVPILTTTPVLAASGDISQVQTFIKSIIQAIVGLAVIVATGFFVVGGFSYITSSGNPEHLDRAKRTIFYSALGLAISIGSFVLSNIVADLATKAFG